MHVTIYSTGCFIFLLGRPLKKHWVAIKRIITLGNTVWLWSFYKVNMCEQNFYCSSKVKSIRGKTKVLDKRIKLDS